MQHLGGAPAGSPLMEMEPNNTQATADTLAPIDNEDGTYTFSVDGDLTTVATWIRRLPSPADSVRPQDAEG